MTTNPCAVWDITGWIHYGFTEDVFRDWCKENCKKWGFQVEECPNTKTLHIQARVSLIKKIRMNGLIESLRADGMLPGSYHLSPTTEGMRDGPAFYQYVNKGLTRVRGPWRDDDPEPVYIPRQCRKIVKLHPWQEEILKMIENSNNDRVIYIVYCPCGNKGKSSFCQLLECQGKGICIPPFCEDAKTLLEWAYAYEAKNYFIDCPRSMDLNSEKWRHLWMGIEELKSGRCYDRRYSSKKRNFDAPNVFVFCNKLPSLTGILSEDRIKFWEIDSSLNLVPKIVEGFSALPAVAVKLENPSISIIKEIGTTGTPSGQSPSGCPVLPNGSQTSTPLFQLPAGSLFFEQNKFMLPGPKAQ